MLWTEDLEATFKFYTQVLGFQCQEKNEDWQWASLYLDDVELMIAHPTMHTNYKEIGFSGSLYMTVTDVDSLWEKLKSQTEVVYELEIFDWGMKEFAIKDNNGYILQFGASVEDDE